MRVGGRVVAVHQRLAAAEKMHVRPIEVQRALERRLQPDSEPLHPAGTVRGPAHDQAGQRFVRAPAGHAQQIRRRTRLPYTRRSAAPSAHRASTAGSGCGGCCRRGTHAARPRPRPRDAPRSLALRAAHRPALPPPSTATSKVSVNPVPEAIVRADHRQEPRAPVVERNRRETGGRSADARRCRRRFAAPSGRRETSPSRCRVRSSRPRRTRRPACRHAAADRV